MIDKPSQEQRLGWKRKPEREHFGSCPVCGELFDCPDLNQVMEHLHGGKVEMVEIFEPPTRST
jgi:hypothetical protein